MAEDSFQEKSQAPTPKRRRDAAEKGEVPRSQEVMTAFLLLASAALLASVGGTVAGAVVDIFAMSVSTVTALPVGPDAVADHLGVVGWKALLGMAPILVTLAGTALAVGAIQARGVLTLKPLEPKWDRLDPLQKAKQIWGWKAVAEFIKSLVKLGIVTIALLSVLDTVVGETQLLGQTSPFALLALIQRYAVKILASVGLAYLALALADYGYQVWQSEKQLKMTREEVKKEVKESEGDQVVKVRRRTMARQFARRRMLISVSEADVVVTNPTHIAVALRYDPATAHAPVVLAMGERKIAQRIRELAREADVPVMENKPLARALFATAQVGMPIPMELFVAVAEILAFVYRQGGAGLPPYGARA
jgi:flagellar biosynthesis protein FlhB